MHQKRDVRIILIILSQTLGAVVMSSIIRASDDIRIVKAWLSFWEVLILVLALLSIAAIKNLYSNARESIKTSLMKEHLRENEIMMTVLQ